ncbi:MAG: hypothetical protein M3011_00655, partial [Actinomycetota bacterium]|nr:hypothetical protein [Actinomycetota bacterium]
MSALSFSEILTSWDDAHEKIDGVPIWYEEHGDRSGPPLVALHGGIVTFEGTFGDVLPWLAHGRR